MELGATAVLVVGLWFIYDTNFRKPRLYDGDREERFDCRMCSGLGYRPDRAGPDDMETCAYCRGQRKVSVIIPGPHRPTRLWGLVVDRERIDSPETYSPEGVRQTASAPTAAPTIPGATVTFRAAGGASEQVTTSIRGRFSLELAPGTYSVEVAAPGFDPYRAAEPLTIEPLTGMVWVARKSTGAPSEESQSIVIMNPEFLSNEELRSTWGLLCLAGLSSRDAEQGFWRTYLRDGGEVTPGFIPAE